MTPENEWLFYSTAAWNIDQAAYVTKMLMDNPPNHSIQASKVVWDSAYKFSIVSYCSPFMGFNTSEGKKNKECLNLDFVPFDLRSTHIQIKDYRDKILAHTDISHLCTIGFGEGFRMYSTSTLLSPPPIEESFRLFAAVGAIILQKLESLDGNTQQA